MFFFEPEFDDPYSDWDKYTTRELYELGQFPSALYGTQPDVPWRRFVSARVAQVADAHEAQGYEQIAGLLSFNITDIARLCYLGKVLLTEGVSAVYVDAAHLLSEAFTTFRKIQLTKCYYADVIFLSGMPSTAADYPATSLQVLDYIVCQMAYLRRANIILYVANPGREAPGELPSHVGQLVGRMNDQRMLTEERH